MEWGKIRNITLCLYFVTIKASICFFWYLIMEFWKKLDLYKNEVYYA